MTVVIDSAKRVLRRLWTKGKPHSYKYLRIVGADEFCSTDLQRYGKQVASGRALLSYISHPFNLAPNHPDSFMFSNVGIARSIVRALNELGYIVDVVDYRDVDYTPRKHYDVFVGHSGYSFEKIARRLDVETVRIYFASTAYWRFHNEQEQLRLDDLQRRRGVQITPVRVLSEEEWALENAHGIICIGNNRTRETYARFPLVYNVNNAAYLDDCFEPFHKDYSSARKNFLYFAGWGNIHKGLDLLLEVFPQVDAHLFICTPLEPEFVRVYQRELENTPNIHVLGWVPMRSPLFYDLVYKCAFNILPSCSEGGAGSVIEGMNHGIVPVISKMCGVDIGDCGITLENCSIEEITDAVRYLSNCSVDWIIDKAQMARKIATTDYTEDIFLENMREAIGKVICHARQPKLV